MKDNIDQDYARKMNRDEDDEVLEGEGLEEEKKGLKDVVGKMSWHKRALYSLLPEKQKKQLEKHSEKKMGRKSVKIQTDNDLLEVSRLVF